MSKYRIVEKNNKQAIFDDKGNQISRWWKRIRYDGIIFDESEYYIVENDNNKVAIFHKDNPDVPITKWWNDISTEGLVNGTSEYYIAENPDNNRCAIFHISDPENPISEWWTYIEPLGLVTGVSNYYIVGYKDGLVAVFYKDNPHEPITKWWQWIILSGLITGDSDYYIVKNNNLFAIFHISGVRITEWKDMHTIFKLFENLKNLEGGNNNETL